MPNNFRARIISCKKCNVKIKVLYSNSRYCDNCRECIKKMNDKINSVKYRDRIVLRNKQWRIKNKDKYKTQGIKQRLRIHTDVVYRERILYGICCCKTKKYYADICFSFNEWMQKKLSINGLCPMCNKKFSLSRLVMDHDFALSKAKSKFLLTNKRYQYYIKDMNALCERCNNVKRTKLLIEVMEHGNH